MVRIEWTQAMLLLVNAFRSDSLRVAILRPALHDVMPNCDKCITSQPIKLSFNHNYGSPPTKQTVPYWTDRTGDSCAFPITPRHKLFFVRIIHFECGAIGELPRE